MVPVMTARSLPRAAACAPPAASAGLSSEAHEAPVVCPEPALFPADPDRGPAFELRAPAALRTPLVCSSPHSGRLYPAEMMALSALDRRDIRRSEDAYVDRLVDGAPGHGAPLLLARHARAYVDLNRAPYELDPQSFAGPAGRPCTRTARAAAGLGSVARVVGEGREIYREPLAFAEAEARLERVHAPFHAELARLMDAAAARFGCAVLLDWHSMPAAAVAAAAGGAAPHVVLGDRYGAAASPAVVRRVQEAFASQGWRVARNQPYAGGWVVERHGRPRARRHAVQVEVRRDLYLDEAAVAPHEGFARLRAALDAVVEHLAAVDWAPLA